MSSSIKVPSFRWSFLLPKYWLIWLGAGIVYLLTWLPYPLIRILGTAAGGLLAKLVKSRVFVAKRNLKLMYPNMSELERASLLKKNVRRAGMGLFETAMGWWWPDWRVRRFSSIEGLEHVEAILAEGKGVFGLALHNLNLEFGCRAIGLAHPSIGFYRKHDNPLMDYFQYHGRSRSNKYMVDKRNARAFLAALDNQELCMYLPDQDYGRRQSLFVPFGGVEKTATTAATLMFARRANCVPLLLSSQYTKTGYRVKIYPPMFELAAMDDIEALTYLNSKIEQSIAEQPDSYLWMHKRFKTRPNKSDESLYKKD